MDEGVGSTVDAFSRPNPPRKRPRRRPDAVERNTRAEVLLTKQTAQANAERSGPEPKSANAKPQPKAAKPGKGAPLPRVRRIDEPGCPVGCSPIRDPRRVHRRAPEPIAGAAAFFTLTAPRPGLRLLPARAQLQTRSIVLAAALVAAPIAKFITKESRALRFMESGSWSASSSTSSGLPSSSRSRSWWADSAPHPLRQPTAHRRQRPRRCPRRQRPRRHPPPRRLHPSSSASCGERCDVVATPVATVLALGISSTCSASSAPSICIRRCIGGCGSSRRHRAVRGRRKSRSPCLTRREPLHRAGSRTSTAWRCEAAARDAATEGSDALTVGSAATCAPRTCTSPSASGSASTATSTSVAGATCSGGRTWTRCAPRYGGSASGWGGLSLNTVFVGGGTPSLVDPGTARGVASATVRSTFDVAVDAEFTMEANPRASVSSAPLSGMAGGANRISIGVQSLEADALHLPRMRPRR